MRPLVSSPGLASVMDRSMLPFDVMSEIMDHSAPITITSLMETCRLLCDEGPRHLLRDGVTLCKPSVVDSFSLFIFAGKSRLRFTFLHELDIRLSYDMTYLASTVARLLSLLTSPALLIDTLSLRDSEVFISQAADRRPVCF
ncbi:hypothetical protein BD311DRAFT_751869 [Dichomitus squalens]|uniref:F-box domain-containing protein n=1 Tax=Dichomitus squalens TaxID=114155 RepID=A0A4Q9MX49_9APHY|nr:hypothetical protein BD311DRAFT_751869 [Dichomitus squalens]